MNRIELEITPDDIANGKKSDPCNCPIALAARRQLGGEVLAFHFDHQAYVEFPGSIVLDVPGKTYIGDDEMLKFMRDFDAGIPVVPKSLSAHTDDTPQENRVRIPFAKARHAANCWRLGIS